MSEIVGSIEPAPDRRSVCLIVQARVGSSRLPGKVLAEIEGVPLLTHVLRRAKAAAFPRCVVLAIPDTAENDPLVAIGEAESVEVSRGSETDVLSRFWWASQRHLECKIICRITADDPFKDPSLIDTACELFVEEWKQPSELSPHYLHLGGVYWPLGLDVEVFSRAALNHAYQMARGEEREHVTPFIRERYGVWTLKDPYARGGIAQRWTVDTQEDLDFARIVYAALYQKNPLFGYDDILKAGF